MTGPRPQVKIGMVLKEVALIMSGCVMNNIALEFIIRCVASLGSIATIHVEGARRSSDRWLTRICSVSRSLFDFAARRRTRGQTLVQVAHSRFCSFSS